MIEQEEAPFRFKIHLFKTGYGQNAGDEQTDTREVRTKAMDFLSSFAAERIDMVPIKDHSGQGKEKIRIMLEINDKDKA